MAIKRMIQKNFRKARRNVCRFIISFDTCPSDYRKNYKELILNGLMSLGLCIIAIVFLMMCALWA